MAKDHAEKKQQSVADRVAAFRWKKGQSGNPAGRPPAPAILSTCLRERLGQLVPGDRQRRTYAQKIAARLVEAALRGSVAAIALIADRVEGKPPQALTGANGSPLIPTDRDSLITQLNDLIEEIKADLSDQQKSEGAE